MKCFHDHHDGQVSWNNLKKSLDHLDRTGWSNGGKRSLERGRPPLIHMPAALKRDWPRWACSWGPRVVNNSSHLGRTALIERPKGVMASYFSAKFSMDGMECWILVGICYHQRSLQPSPGKRETFFFLETHTPGKGVVYLSLFLFYFSFLIWESMKFSSQAIKIFRIPLMIQNGTLDYTHWYNDNSWWYTFILAYIY